MVDLVSQKFSKTQVSTSNTRKIHRREKVLQNPSESLQQRNTYSLRLKTLMPEMEMELRS